MKVSPVDLNLLAVLDAIVRTKSVSRAAEQAGMSKAAMSHALARLRERIDDPVLVRSGQAWHLSDRAEAVRERVREVAESARALLQPEQAFDPQRGVREFRIHATDHMVALLGSDIGAELEREGPPCTLRFLPIQPDDATHLRAGRADLALGVFRNMPPELRTQALFRERFACVLRKGHPRGAGPTMCSPSRSDWREPTPTASRCAWFVRRSCSPPYTISQVWHPRVDADPSHRWFRALVASVARKLGRTSAADARSRADRFKRIGAGGFTAARSA